MEFHYSTYRIRLRHTFTIARSSHDYYDIIFVYLTKDGITGVGEAVPMNRHGEPFDRLLKLALTFDINDLDDSGSLDDWLDQLLLKADSCRSFSMALDTAAHDLWGKLHGEPLYDRLGALPEKTPLTSYTIGIDSIDVIRKKVTEAEQYPILKVKLGTDDDRAIIETIRDCTDKVVRVDANEGWDLETALEMCDWLATKNVEFVEQPLPASDLETTARLKEQSPLKIIADENCLDSRNIPELADAFHGINIKLMKCGGVREGFKMIQMARELDLEIMLGCMIETSVAISAATHLSPLVDYADLDGHILISNDPYLGATVDGG
ncbi:MAG: dipeptide epimerase, partial [Candidatus Marinimicrobia bacterium]|nr:dipeptide epimerase [Candidatus Neomarinimicrobiota bacterium]